MENEQFNLIKNIQITSNLIIKPIFQTMKECTDFILFGLKSIDTVTSSPEGLYDENSIFETMIGAPIDFDTQKQNYKDWLIRKGFEELIEGTKRSL